MSSKTPQYLVPLFIYYSTGKFIVSGVSQRFISQIRNAMLAIHKLLQHPENANNIVAMLHDGSEKSNELLAYTRAIQLEMKEQYGNAFRLRIVAVGWNPKVNLSILHHISESWLASSYYDDPNIEFVTIHNNDVVAFTPNNTPVIKLPESKTNAFIYDVQKNGVDISRIIYDNEPQKNMLQQRIDALINHNQKADLIVLGNLSDSTTNDLIELEKDKITSLPVELPVTINLLQLFDPRQATSENQAQCVSQVVSAIVQSAIYNFTEPGKRDPVLLGHVKGLMAEKLEDDKYLYGLRKYLEKSYNLMKKMGIGSSLIAHMKKLNENQENIHRIKINNENYAKEYYNITPEQLVCMAYRPFINKGINLPLFLTREYPVLLPRLNSIRDIFANEYKPDKISVELIKQLQKISGLELWQLQNLYKGR